MPAPQELHDSTLYLIRAETPVITGDSSRIDVAAAYVESLFHQNAVNKVFEIVNQGNRPNIIDWEKLFSELPL
ncbi:MAG: hypothetical protein RLZZ184_1193 [Cyanobacteriota bacterium]|jgi:hypothetical protein